MVEDILLLKKCLILSFSATNYINFSLHKIRLKGEVGKYLIIVNIFNITEFPTTLPTVGVPPVIEKALGVVVVIAVPAKNRKN